MTAQQLSQPLGGSSLPRLAVLHQYSQQKVAQMLLKLDYCPEDFAPSLGINLAQRGTLYFSLGRLLWSAITVGRDSWNRVVQSGMYSTFEIIYRSSLLLANLEMSKGKKVVQSSAYKNLDPSEKSSISYFVGLTCAKLFAQKFFGASWLMHLDVYKKALNPQFLVGASRPDLVGTDKYGRWVTFEAKGRTHHVGSDTKAKAKGQANQLASVNNQPVYLAVGLVSYFNSGDKLEVYLRDPPIRQGLSLHIDSRALFIDYYKLFIDLIDSDYGRSERTAFGERTYLTKYITEIDSRVGVDEEIYNHARKERAMGFLERVSYFLPETADESEDATEPLVGEDGIYVAVGRRWISRFVEAK